MAHNNRHQAPTWNPNPRLDYYGPYPFHELQNARRLLITCLKNPRSEALMKVMPKCGIPTRYGPALCPPPVRSAGPVSPPSQFSPRQPTAATGPRMPTASTSTSANSTALITIPRQEQTIDSYTSSNSSSKTINHSPEKIMSSNYDKPHSRNNSQDEASSAVYFSNIHSPQKMANNRYEPSKADLSVKRKPEEMSDSNIAVKKVRKDDYPRSSSNDKSMKDIIDLVSMDKIQAIVNTVKSQSPDKNSRNHDSDPPSSDLNASALSYTSPRKDRIPFLNDSQSESEQEPEASADHFQNKVEKIRTFKVWKSLTDPHGVTPNVENILKCDSCNYASATPNVMKNHLENVCHYSASTYKAVVTANEIQLVCVSSMLEIVNEKAAFKLQVIRCPDCKELFKDIFMCALHHKTSHGSDSLNGMYSVCPVMAEDVWSWNLCKHCETTYSNCYGLQKHWRSNPGHKPKAPKQQGSEIIYFCEHETCRKVSFSIEAAVVHTSRHSHSKHGKPAVQFKERRVVIGKVSIELPPFDSQTESALRKELAIRLRMRHFYNKYGLGKSKRRRNLEEYRKLKTLLGYEGDNGQDEEWADEDDNSDEL